METTKMNPKQMANKLIAEHMEKLEIQDPTKLRTALKISQNDAGLVYAYMTLAKAETIGRFTKVKKNKLEAGKETPETK